jgi:Mg-chelatase subunit ChlD
MNQDLKTTDTNLQSRPAQLDYILLDASGSMTPKRDDSLNAIDNYVAQLRGENVNSTIRVASFTTNYESGLTYTLLRDSTPESWSDMRFDQELPREGGSTPLYDAINMMAREIRSQLPQKCSVIIITDGDENASKTTVDQAKALLDWMRSMGWQVTFLGCDFENSRQAKLLGANDENAIGVSAKRLVDATSLLAEKRARYGLYGTDMNMSKDEKNEIGGLLPDHTAK